MKISYFRSNPEVKSFIIYHLLQKEDKVILHIRQAASLIQNAGYGKQLFNSLLVKFPCAYYEANQRKGNIVPIKDEYIKQGLLQSGEPFLGYNQYYKGLSTKLSIMSSFFVHEQKKKCPKMNYALDEDVIYKRVHHKKMTFI